MPRSRPRSRELDAADRPEFLASAGFKEPGLFSVIRAGYELLGLITFFTAGDPEVHAWTITKGTLAPAAAGTIHTDFEKGFIRAEVIRCGGFDFVRQRSEVPRGGQNCRSKARNTSFATAT